MTERRFDWLPFGLALLALGIGVAAVTLLSISADDVSYARTQGTARLAMVLAAPAIVLAVLGAAGGPWWRSFWTAGFLAYLLHFWWSIIRTFHGDLGAVVERQDWVAYSNFAATAIWGLDVLLAWLPVRTGRPGAWLRVLAWLLVTASFIVASAVFRSGFVAAMGYGLAALVAAAVIVRLRGHMAAAPAWLPTEEPAPTPPAAG
jgi:hypothetical protein